MKVVTRTYNVAFTNMWSRDGVEADSPEEAMKIAEAEMPQQWKDEDVGACVAEEMCVGTTDCCPCPHDMYPLGNCTCNCHAIAAEWMTQGDDEEPERTEDPYIYEYLYDDWMYDDDAGIL